MSERPPLCIRVWGEFACFTRPELKVELASYELLNPSAARGILEAIFWEPQMYYIIDSIAVVKRGRWVGFRRNEVQKTISVPEVQKWMRGTREVSFIEAGGGEPRRPAEHARAGRRGVHDRSTRATHQSRCSTARQRTEVH